MVFDLFVSVLKVKNLPKIRSENMKIYNKLTAVSLIALTGFGVVGCSDDDKSLQSSDPHIEGQYGNIEAAVIVSETKAYFKSSKSWGDTSLYQFNPSNGQVETNPISGFEGIHIQSLELSPSGQLWIGIGDFNAPKVSILDVSNNTLAGTIELSNNPSEIVFTGNLSGDCLNACALIKGVAPDYSSSDITIAEAVSPFDYTEGFAATDKSDISVAVNGNEFYRIGRFGENNLSKYDLDNPNSLIWQYSLNDEGGEANSNPYDVLAVSDSKSYVIRNGESSILIVDHSVVNSGSEGFVLGRVDISGYDSDGIPNASAALVHNGVLYVVTQALDGAWAPGQAYLIAIDTDTNEEITLASGNLKGLPLETKNPYDIDIFDGNLYITSVGRYGSGDRDPEYTGGIEVVSLSNFASTVLIDD